MFERMERLRLQRSLTSQRQCPQLDKARGQEQDTNTISPAFKSYKYSHLSIFSASLACRKVRLPLRGVYFIIKQTQSVSEEGY